MDKIDWGKLVKEREEEREKKRLSGFRMPGSFEPKPWGVGEHIEYEWDKGILNEDVFFAGLEDEIERVNKKLGLE